VCKLFWFRGSALLGPGICVFCVPLFAGTDVGDLSFWVLCVFIS
jgi:hypothetical protein